MPTCSAMLSTNAVLPMLGRPAMMTRSEGWKPQVSWSRSVKPEATPVTWSFFSKSFSMTLKLSLTTVAHRHEPGADAALGER